MHEPHDKNTTARDESEEPASYTFAVSYRGVRQILANSTIYLSIGTERPENLRVAVGPAEPYRKALRRLSLPRLHQFNEV